MRWLHFIWSRPNAYRVYYLGVKSGTCLPIVFIGLTSHGTTVFCSFFVASRGKVSERYSFTVTAHHYPSLTSLINVAYYSGNACHAQTILSCALWAILCRPVHWLSVLPMALLLLRQLVSLKPPSGTRSVVRSLVCKLIVRFFAWLYVLCVLSPHVLCDFFSCVLLF